MFKSKNKRTIKELEEKVKFLESEILSLKGKIPVRNPKTGRYDKRKEGI